MNPAVPPTDLRTLRIAGIDEAGRGPLAGPVVIAAVVFAPGRTPINGLDDSKQLCLKRREALYPRIIARALAWKIVFIEADEIDRRNIFQATLHGMRRALEGVMPLAQYARIDGNRLPSGLPCPAEAIIGGDASDRAIMAASILAKVARDRHMRVLHLRYPDYGFDVHKGYPTPSHREALARVGPCPEHRRSFAPVRAALQSRDLFPELAVAMPAGRDWNEEQAQGYGDFRLTTIGLQLRTMMAHPQSISVALLHGRLAERSLRQHQLRVNDRHYSRDRPAGALLRVS